MRKLSYATLLILAGCTHAPGPAEFAARCQGYGFRPETDAMAGCVQNEALAWRAAYAASLAYSAQVQANSQATIARGRALSMGY